MRRGLLLRIMLRFNAPLLFNFLKNGDDAYGVAHAAERLSLIPGLDITEPLRQAARNADLVSVGFVLFCKLFSIGVSRCRFALCPQKALGRAFEVRSEK